MPRPARFTDDEVVDAALTCVARNGHGVAVADVAEALGGPVGSIYHRFPSREALLIRLWLRSIARFQAGIFVIADGAPADRALIDAALHVPSYCRDHPDEARALTLYRRDRLLPDCPADLRDEVDGVNAEIDALTRRLAKERFGSAARPLVQLVVLATRVSPYGLVRPYIGRPVPHIVDDAVEAAAIAILALGDR